jgi:hypothetical protein
MMISLIVALSLMVVTAVQVTRDQLDRSSSANPPGRSASPMSSPARNAWITVRPDRGASTATVDIRGAGFPANQQVMFSISNGDAWPDLGSARTNAFGELIVSFNLATISPATGGLTVGPHRIVTNVNNDPLFNARAMYTVVE